MSRRLGLIMTILLSLNCTFRSDLKVVSLSGPITYLLQELHLLKSSQVQAISEFHHIPKVEFPGEQIAAGLYLSPKAVKKYSKAFIFYDHSQEYRRLLETAKHPEKAMASLDTRGLDPFEAQAKTQALLEPYLKNCEEKLSQLNLRLGQLKKELLSLPSLKVPVVFYLGEVSRKNKDPELIMVKDGFMLWGIREKRFESYPSDLAYVTWSGQVIQNLEKKGLVKVGYLARSGWTDLITVDNKTYLNAGTEAILIPGLPQINFLKNLLKFLHDQK